MIIDSLMPSDEQLMLQQAAGRFLSQEYSFEKRGGYLKSARRHSREVWDHMVAMGWTEMPFAADDGGLEIGMPELCGFAEELGRRLVVEPYVSTVILAGSVIASASPSALRRQLIERISREGSILACATTESGSGYRLNHVATQAKSVDGGYVLSGSKSFVCDAPLADVILVSARIAGAVDDLDGISIFAVSRSTTGLSLVEHARIDGGLAADLLLDEVFVDADALLGESGTGHDLLLRGVQKASLFLAAEAVGVMKTALDMTAEHVSTRAQFGMPLAAFQAVQHKIADMFVAMKRVESLVAVAAAASTDDMTELLALTHAAKAMAGISGRFVGEQCIQLHGGIGVTDECMTSHCLKRLLAINALFGNVQHCSKAFRDSITPR